MWLQVLDYHQTYILRMYVPDSDVLGTLSTFAVIVGGIHKQSQTWRRSDEVMSVGRGCFPHLLVTIVALTFLVSTIYKGKKKRGRDKYVDSAHIPVGYTRVLQ
ncbi:hypothetical protein GGS21DRAFT_498681 [Xylaria nigripes]|nr:hypothetical protein GGS21DRAFT_498681 [Xylaria nigripes]